MGIITDIVKGKRKMEQVKIINGPHKGKTGTLTGMFWWSNIATVDVDGEEIAVNITDIKKI